MNASLQKLLTLLADGSYHSGEGLGEQLGVSRAAVWKQLQQLQELGVPLTSAKGMGYCIEGGLDLLDRHAILEHFEAQAGESKNYLRELFVEMELDSSSQFLLRKSSAAEPVHGLACFAEKQSAGRGRRGRSWHSPFASNLYFSIGWRIENGVAAVEGLSLAVGVALCEVLESFGFEGVQLKWPNDLLYNGKKLGGILLEINGDAAGECDLVLGVGMNVSMPAEAAQEIDQAWTDLTILGLQLGLPRLPSRNQLAARFLDALLQLLICYEEKGFAAWRERWLKRDANTGKHVALHSGTKDIEGRVEGVSDTGALLLRTEKGLQGFIGGEISLRPLR